MSVMPRATFKMTDLKRAVHDAGRALTDGSKVADAATRRFADREPA